MKKLFPLLIVFFLIIFFANCQAGDFKNVTILKKLAGDWYDENGNVALKIGSNYTINGCIVLDSEPLEGSSGYVRSKMKIIEKNGYRDLILDYFSSYTARELSEENYHEMIIIDTKNFYYRSKDHRYVESIGGIYLGMNKNEILKIYGEPSKIENNQYHQNHYKLIYENEGFEVSLYGDVVFSISIYDYGNMKFDNSGLSAKNSIEEYKNFYKPKKDIGRIKNSAFYIGHGEVIAFSRKTNNEIEYITLFIDD